MIVLAFLPQLRFLDFTMVDEDEVMAAKEQYQDDLMELEEKERMSSAMLERDELKSHKTSLLVDACIDPIETLFDSMYMEDNEILKLLVLPGVDVLKSDYNEKLTALADDVKGDGLAIRQRQLREIDKLNTAILRVQSKRQEQAIEAITTYDTNIQCLKDQMYKAMDEEDVMSDSGGGMSEQKIKQVYIGPMKAFSVRKHIVCCGGGRWWSVAIELLFLTLCLLCVLLCVVFAAAPGPIAKIIDGARNIVGGNDRTNHR
jgi:hypothetical protein